MGAASRRMHTASCPRDRGHSGRDQGLSVEMAPTTVTFLAIPGAHNVACR